MRVGGEIVRFLDFILRFCGISVPASLRNSHTLSLRLAGDDVLRRSGAALAVLGGAHRERQLCGGVLRIAWAGER